MDVRGDPAAVPGVKQEAGLLGVQLWSLPAHPYEKALRHNSGARTCYGAAPRSGSRAMDVPADDSLYLRIRTHGFFELTPVNKSEPIHWPNPRCKRRMVKR